MRKKGICQKIGFLLSCLELNFSASPMILRILAKAKNNKICCSDQTYSLTAMTMSAAGTPKARDQQLSSKQYTEPENIKMCALLDVP